MNKKIEEWLNSKGRRHAELKIKTANSLTSYPKQEDVADWAEYFNLDGQLENLIWIFQPKINKTKFIEEIDNKLCELLEEAIMLNKKEIGNA